jgi:hypothetical protein
VHLDGSITFDKKWGLDTFWAISSQAHLVTLTMYLHYDINCRSIFVEWKLFFINQAEQRTLMKKALTSTHPPPLPPSQSARIIFLLSFSLIFINSTTPGFSFKSGADQHKTLQSARIYVQFEKELVDFGLDI